VQADWGPGHRGQEGGVAGMEGRAGEWGELEVRWAVVLEGLVGEIWLVSLVGCRCPQLEDSTSSLSGPARPDCVPGAAAGGWPGGE